MKRVLLGVLEGLFVLAVWAGVIWLVRPRGEFPLHDDWDFSVATWNFARTGHFHFTPFTAVSLRAQVLWGALWTRLLGQSFEVLRLSTLTLSAATLLIVNRILHYTTLRAFARITATLALLAHPIFLWASCTYMTDVPYLFASALAFYFFLRGLRDDRMLFVIVGCLAAILSWFVRQNGVINLLPPLVMILIQRRGRRLVVPIVVTLAAFAALFFFKPDWLAGAPDMFAMHYHMLSESSFRLPEQIALVYHYIIFNLLNCGIFFLPLTLPLMMRRTSQRSAIVLVAIAIVILWRVLTLGIEGYWMPYAARHLYSDILPGPIVFDFGIGPPNLTDVFSMGYNYPFGLETKARIVLTLASACLAALLIWALANAAAKKDLTLRMAIASAVIGTAALCLSGYYYDRYSLDSAWALVIALPIAIPWEKASAKVTAIVALLAIGFFSTMAVQEYFAWNRARWDMYRELRARGIAIEQIDGGVEAYSLYELANADRKKAAIGHPPRKYMITFHPLPGYHVIVQRPFDGFLGYRRGVIYGLQMDGT
ncbi:MAG TPA: glycosyltransferase family 39 protein [Thermoanaerobaculia bacterium]|nr:glycosyltransferase family 39 protein [Thermoanaerobaculia bacterium]